MPRFSQRARRGTSTGAVASPAQTVAPGTISFDNVIDNEDGTWSFDLVCNFAWDPGWSAFSLVVDILTPPAGLYPQAGPGPNVLPFGADDGETIYVLGRATGPSGDVEGPENSNFFPA